MMPWILGCGGCLGLLVIVGIVLGVLGYVGSHGSRSGKTYTSSADSLNPELAEHYVPFSFDYPSDWTVVENGSGSDAKNFVKVEKKDAAGTTAENFAVGYMYATPGQENNPELIAQLLTQFEQQFAQNFPNFRRVSDDHATIDGREASGFRFTAHAPADSSVEVLGRVLVLPIGEGKGLSFVMLATPQGDVQTVEDLGEKGGIPTILRSFRIRQSTAGAAGTDTTTAAPSDAGSTGDNASGITGDDTVPTTTSDDQTTPTDGQTNGGEPEIKEIKPLGKP